MKIGLISNMYPSEKDIKYGIFVKGLVDSLSKKGCEFVFLSVIRGRSTGKISKILEYMKLYSMSVIYLLFKTCDLVYVHYPLHLAPLIYVIDFFMIKPLIINFHGTDLKPESRILVFFEKILKRSMKNTKMIVVPSEFLKKEVAEKFGVSFERIFVSPSGGVNFDIFKSFDDNPSSVKEFSAGFISRIEKDKGWDVFVQALDELKKRNILHDRKFLIVGTGSQKKELITMVEQFGLEKNIKYCESTDQKDLPKYFNSIDVFVFPSKRESLGLVGLESMACGTPVIGSKIGGISDYLRDSENGMFFSAGDYIDLAEKIEKFMRLTKIEKMRLKENALNTAKDYDRDRIVSIFYNKLKSIVEIRG